MTAASMSTETGMKIAGQICHSLLILEGKIITLPKQKTALSSDNEVKQNGKFVSLSG